MDFNTFRKHKLVPRNFVVKRPFVKYKNQHRGHCKCRLQYTSRRLANSVSNEVDFMRTIVHRHGVLL